jgi:hypothetical protein
MVGNGRPALPIAGRLRTGWVSTGQRGGVSVRVNATRGKREAASFCFDLPEESVICRQVLTTAAR